MPVIQRLAAGGARGFGLGVGGVGYSATIQNRQRVAIALIGSRLIKALLLKLLQVVTLL